MGIEARRIALNRSKKNFPPILSHEFVIQNHGDIISSVLMLVLFGFMFKPTLSIAQLFIVLQYNDTVTFLNETASKVFYLNGVYDIPCLLFYLCTCIAVHCAIQEYFVDRIQRRFHLSKTSQTKFNESFYLALFSIYSVIHAGYLLYEMNIHKDVTLLWTGYPEVHKYMSFNFKVFYIVQIAFWGHQIPEFYFQKLKYEEIKDRLYYVVPFMGFTLVAYFLNFTRVGLVLLFLEYFSQVFFHIGRLVYFSGKVRSSWTAFKLWNFICPIVRLAIIVVAVLTFWYGFRSLETPYINIFTGNYNTRVIRLNCLVSILLIQLFLVYKFAHFQLLHFNIKMSLTAQKKKTNNVSSKQRKSKNDEKQNATESKKQKQKSL